MPCTTRLMMRDPHLNTITTTMKNITIIVVIIIITIIIIICCCCIVCFVVVVVVLCLGLSMLLAMLSVGDDVNTIAVVSVRISSACRSAERVTFRGTTVMATVVTCRVRNPACTATSTLGEGALHKWLTRSASDAVHVALYK